MTAYQMADSIFYQRHPELFGRRIQPNETQLRNEWLSILRTVQPRSRPGSHRPRPVSTGDADVAAAKRIAVKPVPGMPGVTLQQLIEQWRPGIAPEIPLPVLIAFMRFESGGNFSDATHGSPKNNYTKPPFYELGVFQTPAGLHGVCTTGHYQSCAHPPPGPEKPGDPSQWVKLCRRIGADPNDWQNPTTQVRVGLLDLKLTSNIIRKRFPRLFPNAAGEWYLRMAVLMPFAGGAGYTTNVLRTHGRHLEGLPEDQRWDYLRGKLITAYEKNIEEKMALARKIGYTGQ